MGAYQITEAEKEQRKRISDTAKKVAQLLAENQVTFTEVDRVFHDVKFHLTVSYQGDHV